MFYSEWTDKVLVAKGGAPPEKGKGAPAKGKGAAAKGGKAAVEEEAEEAEDIGPVYLKEQDHALLDALKQAAERVKEAMTPLTQKRKACGMVDWRGIHFAVAHRSNSQSVE